MEENDFNEKIKELQRLSKSYNDKLADEKFIKEKLERIQSQLVKSRNRIIDKISKLTRDTNLDI